MDEEEIILPEGPDAGADAEAANAFYRALNTKKAAAAHVRNSLFQCANVSAKAATLCFASNKSIHRRWTVSPSLDVKATGLDEAAESGLG